MSAYTPITIAAPAVSEVPTRARPVDPAVAMSFAMFQMGMALWCPWIALALGPAKTPRKAPNWKEWDTRLYRMSREPAHAIDDSVA